MNEVRDLCEKYSLDDVTVFDDVSKERIKRNVWELGRMNLWDESVKNRRVPFNRTYIKTPKPYMRRNRYESRLFFAFRIGELQFKDYRRGEFTKIFGDTKCFAPRCQSPDTLEHVMRCSGYPSDLRFELTNYNYDPIEQEEFIQYLKRLDGYRASKYNLPVIYRPSLKKRLEREVRLSLQ